MSIVGHRKQLNILQKSLEKQRLAHAYLFSGPPHLGKFLVALNFAAQLAGGAETENNPNLIIIRPENVASEDTKKLKKNPKKEIKIDQIRELQRKLSLFSGSGQYQVAIIDGAEKMNKQAQNALLKTLEEPNDSSLIILVASSVKKILPTISSRCQKIKFGPVPLEEMERWIKQKGFCFKDEAQRKRIIFWSLGRPGMIQNLLADNSKLIFREETLLELKKMLEQNLAERFSLAEELAKDKEGLLKKLNLWLIILRQALLEENGLKMAPAKMLDIIDATEKSLETLRDTNSNSRLVLENLLLKF